MNPWAEASEGVDPDAYNRPAAGQPELWCQWEVCWDGCCLAFDGDEKFYRPLRWMEYLIDHFLRPGAHASTSGLVTFEEFTFDHVLVGMVIGCRRSDKELFAIDVEDNVVTRRLLAAGDEAYEGWPPLPYEEQIDRLAASRASRKRRTRSDLRVVTSPE